MLWLYIKLINIIYLFIYIYINYMIYYLVLMSLLYNRTCGIYIRFFCNVNNFVGVKS